MKMYIVVESAVDTYGAREIRKIFSTKKAASKWIRTNPSAMDLFIIIKEVDDGSEED